MNPKKEIKQVYIPRSKQRRKEHTRRQEESKERKRNNYKLGTALVVFALIIGAGIFVYNMDEVYKDDKNHITISYPTSFKEGGEVPLAITLSDFEGGPVSNEELKIELEYTQNNRTQRLVLETEQTDKAGTSTPVVKLPDDYNGTAQLIVSVGSQELKQKIKILEPTVGTGPAAGVSQTDEQLKILISTDKPLYQPGQTILIRTLALYGEVNGVYEDDITVEIDDPDGNKLFRTELDCNDWGIANTSFSVTDQMPIGNYKIMAKVGEVESKKSVTIKRYVLPKFNIVLDGIKSWYTVDEDIAGTVNCNYFFGKPVKGDIKFSARTYYGGIWDTVYSTTGSMTDDGEFEFSVPAVNYVVGLPFNQDNGLVELNATITDHSGHAETKLMPVSIAKQPILITAISDTNLRGAESNYYILAQAPDGSIVEDANVSASLDSQEVFTGKTSEKGLAEIKFQYDGEQELGIMVEKGSSRSTEAFELKEGLGLKLVTNKLYYAIGDRAEFDVYYSGESFTKWVYYDVLSNGFTVTTGCFKLSGGSIGSGSFSIDLTPEMVGSTYVRIYKIEKNENVISDRVGLAVAPVSELNVAIEKDDEIYNPNQPVTLKFKVTEGETPVQGALGISIIDQSLYALSERYGGFEDIYFELEKTALEPRYQVWEYLYSPDPVGTSIPLPEKSVIDPGEYEEGSVYHEIGIKSNYNTEQDNAEEAKNEYVVMYWTGLFIIGFIGLVGLVFYGIRRSKPMIAVGIMGLLLLAAVVGGVVLNLDDFNVEDESDSASLGQERFEGAPGGEGESEAESESEAEGEFEDTDGDFIPRDAEEGAKADNNDDGLPGQFRPGLMNWDSDNDALTNLEEYDVNTDPQTPSSNREERQVHVREWFPETWYWNPVLITDETGTAELKLTTPDSITTWEIKAVASTKDAKVGVNNENLTVFQQFFIEPDIPVSVVRNDTFPLRIMVYNYDNVSHDITIYLEEDGWFEAMDETTKKVTVQADNVSKVMFKIRALEVGEHNVTVSGYNGKAWDDIIKSMRVDPDGKMVSATINGKLSDNQSIEETITKSSERVPDSENAFIKLQGGMEAVLMDGAETFIRRVSGCGEQSMSSLNIDVLAFDTVQKVGTATEEKMFEYELIVTDGLQHELQYLVDAQNGQGRGIVWFPSDPDVHQWLTSWGLITFQDAIDAGFDVDSAIIADMQTWLLSQQESDGSFIFPERGLYEFTNPILRSKTVSCSAYITRSLIYSGYSSGSSAIQSAIGYIEDHAKDQEVWDDPYSVALVLTVLEDANGDYTLRNELAGRLDELKTEDVTNGTVYWTSGTSMITDSDDMGFVMEGGWGYGSNYHIIEATGYAIMALAKHKNPSQSTVQKGIKYLIDHRQGLGGWFSTQDTVVAFQTLKAAGTNRMDELEIQVYADNQLVDKIDFDENNIDMTYIVDLRPYLKETTDITLKSTGSGSVMFQIYYEEYIPWEIIGANDPKELLLEIDYDATNIKVTDKIKATLTLEYQGSASHVKMVLVDIRAPVGFSFMEEDFEAMITSGKISQYEINERQAYLYIEDLSYGQVVEVTYYLEANDPIRGTIQGVQAYDMYNPDLKVELEPIEIIATD